MSYVWKAFALAGVGWVSVPSTVFAQALDQAEVALFWGWVEENETRLAQSETIIELFDEIDAALDQVHPGLVFEFGRPQDGKTPFVISADGFLEYFPAVEELVSSAPQLTNLSVIAFRQPIQDFTGNVLTLNGKEMAAEELRFQEFTDQGDFDLVLVHPFFGTADRDPAIGLAFLMLDSALGEYQVATQVGYIDFVSPEELEAIDYEFVLRDFSELPAVFNEFGSRR